MSNQDNFKAVMATIGTVYNKEMSGEFIDIYWNVLGGYNPDFLANALRLHMSNAKEGRFLPTPAHLIGQIEIMVESEKRAAYFNEQSAKAAITHERTPQQEKNAEDALNKLKGMM